MEFFRLSKNSFAVYKYLKSNEEIVLEPMTSGEIEYQVLLRTIDIDKNKNSSSIHHSGHHPSKHLIDIYFVIFGLNGSTKKIYMNNYEIKRADHDDPKEKYFEFKSEDVGKLQKINVSINQDDNPNNFICIDFIEIKIPIRSEAYKFPMERVLGEFYEDGKCDIDLIVWKHPERPNHIEYEILTEINEEAERETMGRLYLIMHGDQGKTGKIVLNDGNFDNNSIDNYEFSAPDVGKLTRIELFFYPSESDTTWQLESVEVKLKTRNEAYKFPVRCVLDSKTNYLELIPWKKPQVNK